ncbi:hypothetical protein FQR65_LT17777 [Abscondita terminalis]|nr:hypothetical protein FQR65_LT17777 [Abscondita terminalis]
MLPIAESPIPGYYDRWIWNNLYINLKTGFMKLNFAGLALAVVLPVSVYGQDSIVAAMPTATKEQKPDTDLYAGSKTSPIPNKSKRFNEWSVSAGMGTVIMKSGSFIFTS